MHENICFPQKHDIYQDEHPGEEYRQVPQASQIQLSPLEMKWSGHPLTLKGVMDPED